MSTSPVEVADLLARLARSDEELARSYPGAGIRHQPVHTVYVGADRFQVDTARFYGSEARAVLARHGPDPETFGSALGAPPPLWDELHERVTERLDTLPVEDLRVDFEDGYGTRPDREEDEEARRVGSALAEAHRNGLLPPGAGIRVKPLAGRGAARALRTLQLVVNQAVDGLGGELPPGFVVTMPKAEVPEQVAVAAEFLARLEARLRLADGSIPIEIMIETTAAVLDETGRVRVRALTEAAGGRCRGAHFGTYDYTASCGITAAHQSLVHPVCDFARHVMQVALAGTGVTISDGSTNVLPAETDSDDPATNRQRVHTGWRLHHDHVRHSLFHGIYQGWDLHPAQLPSRYGAVFGFFLEAFRPAATRLRALLTAAAHAPTGVVDDLATGQALLGHVVRAVRCGAVTVEEAAGATGLEVEDLHGRHLSEVLATRGGAGQLPR